MKQIIPFLAFPCGFAAVSLHAAVVMDTTPFFSSGNNLGTPSSGPALVDEGGGNYSYTFTSFGGFTASGSDKLILAFQNKDHNNSLTGPQIISVTYNSVSMTQAVQYSSDRQRNSVFFLDDVASDGNLKITFTDGVTSDQGAWILGLYALSGTASGFNASLVQTARQDVTNLSTGGPTITTTANSAFVLNMWARNNGNPGLTSSVGGFTADWDANVEAGSGDLGSLIASTIVNAPGSYGTTVSDVGGAVPQMTFTGIAFEQVPEPSSALLGGLGVIALLRRRR